MRLSFRVPRSSLFPLTAVLALAAVPASTAAAPGNKPTLEAGDACLKTSKGCDPLKVGSPFPLNEELQAGEHGALIRLGDGTTLDLTPGTVLKIQVVMPVPLGPGAPVKSQTMALLSGKFQVDASPKNGAKRAILLRGPGKAQLIVSGTAVVSLRKETLSAVNLGGKMLATTANDWNDIPAGKALSLSKTEPKPQLRDTLPAPKITGGRWVTTTMADSSEALTLSWSEVPRAGSYEVRLVSASGEVLKRTSLGPRETSYSAAGLPPGSYELRLAVLDEGGLDGAAVPPVKLAVIDVGLPPGGFRSGPSAVQVAEGQTVTLGHAGGVELAYDKGTTYTPAGKGFVMRGDQLRLLRFRFPGATIDGLLRVEPRSLAAQVELSPRNARWPRDTISATVRLINKSGGAVPPDVKMVPTVTLGVAPLQVTFQEESYGVLKASIPPQPGQLPAALRIEVHDQHGIYLGRGFVEIAKLPGGMSGQTWHVEMLWRCASCGERNLGRHTQCQRCGKPKTGKETYEMPGDTSAAAAISDPALLRMATAGANWRCHFCGSDQRRFDGACGHCGASQQQGVDLGAVSPHPSLPPPARGQKTPPSAQPQRGWKLLAVVASLGLLLVLCGVFAAVRRPGPDHPHAPVAAKLAPSFRDVTARLVGVSWEQSVLVERYKVLPGEGFEEARPADAFDVKKAGQRAHHDERVPDGFSTETYTENEPDGSSTETYTTQEPCGETCVDLPQSCTNQCTPGNNGFATCKQVCKGGGRSCTPKQCTVTKTRQVPRTKAVTKTRQIPRFKEVPVMRDWYTWSVWGWAPQRTIKATGTTPEVAWPPDSEVALGKGLGKGEKERENRRGFYTLRLAEPSGVEHQIHPATLEEFQHQARSSTFLIRVEYGRARILESSGAPAASSSR